MKGMEKGDLTHLEDELEDAATEDTSNIKAKGPTLGCWTKEGDDAEVVEAFLSCHHAAELGNAAYKLT